MRCGAADRRRPLALILAAVALLVSPPAARAQSAGEPPARPDGFLAPDHWVWLALRRVAAEGLVPVSWIDAPGSARLADVRRALERAATDADADSTARQAASESLARLEADFGPAPRAGPLLSVRIDLGAAARHGERIAGLAIPSPTGFDYSPPETLHGRDRMLTRISGYLGAGPFIAGVDLDPGDRLRQLDVSVRAGPLDVRLGRQALAFGPGAGEGIVLGPRNAFDGLGLNTADAFSLPSFLRGLGGVRASLLVARMDASGDVAHPWFAASRIAVTPSPGWTIALNRAAIFGGENNDAITARRLALALLGFRDTRGKDSDFENQMASIDVVTRIGGPLALMAWAEIGIDDIGRPLDRVLGGLAGIEADRIPGAPRLAVGAEIARFGDPCCGFSPWYRHGRLAAGWSDGGRILGHSLGGHGREAALTWRLDPGGRGALAAGRFFLRRRGADNVFAPDLLGTGAGAGLRFSWPVSSLLRLDASGEFESGDGWHRWSAAIILGGRITGPAATRARPAPPPASRAATRPPTTSRPSRSPPAAR